MFFFRMFLKNLKIILSENDFLNAFISDYNDRFI